MRFIDYIRTAFKNLSRQKARTFLTIFAVIVGAVSVVIMLSLVVGAKQVAMDQMEKMGQLTQVAVVPSDDINNYNSTGDSVGTKLDDTMVTQVSAISHVVAVSPSIGVWGYETMELKGGNGKKVRPNFTAYIPGPSFDPPIVAGRQLLENDIAKIVISGETLRSFCYEKNPEAIIGKIVILTAKGNYSGYGVTPAKPPQNADQKWWDEQQNNTVTVEAEIVGAQTQGLGNNTNYITIAWAHQIMTSHNWKMDEAKKQQYEEARKRYEEQMQQAKFNKTSGQQVSQPTPFDDSEMMILDANDEITSKGYGSILLKVDDTANVESVAEAARKFNVGAQTAKQTLDSITKVFNLVGAILGAIGLIALFVASIGIVNTMIMAIYERTHEIGVMRACGATRGTVRRLFTFEAGLLGFIGGLIGLGISYGLAFVGNIIVSKITTSQNIDVQAILSFPLWLVVGVIIFTTVVGLLAGLYPAFKAAKLNPVEALRYE